MRYIRVIPAATGGIVACLDRGPSDCDIVELVAGKEMVV